MAKPQVRTELKNEIRRMIEERHNELEKLDNAELTSKFSKELKEYLLWDKKKRKFDNAALNAKRRRDHISDEIEKTGRISTESGCSSKYSVKHRNDCNGNTTAEVVYNYGHGPRRMNIHRLNDDILCKLMYKKHEIDYDSLCEAIKNFDPRKSKTII